MLLRFKQLMREGGGELLGLTDATGEVYRYVHPDALNDGGWQKLNMGLYVEQAK
jgi:hypothetical protein